jgi:hypothetical protein
VLVDLGLRCAGELITINGAESVAAMLNTLALSLAGSKKFCAEGCITALHQQKNTWS